MLARKRRISYRYRVLTFKPTTPHLKQITLCVARQWPPTGGHSTKIIFHIHATFDLWWLNCGLMVLWYNILIKINQRFIKHLLVNNVTSSIRHLRPTLYKWREKTCCGKRVVKNTEIVLKWIKHSFYNMLFCLFLTQSNHHLAFRYYFTESYTYFLVGIDSKRARGGR